MNQLGSRPVVEVGEVAWSDEENCFDGKEVCVDIRSFSELELIRRECGSREVCKDCSGKFKQKIEYNEVVIPKDIVNFLNLKEGQRYSVSRIGENKYLVDFKENTCILCEKEESNTRGLISIKDKYVCKECLEVMKVKDLIS